jgi:beta-lactam-binding protein with PASTA domain
MKLRRRFATEGPLGRFLGSLRRRFPAAGHADGTDGTPADGASPGWGDASRDSAAPRPLSNETASAEGGSHALPRWLRWWPWPPPSPFVLRMVGLFAGMFVAGYLFAAIVLFPAPFVTTSRSVPRVLGTDEASARETLRGAGFGIGTVQRIPHAVAPSGTVVGQDPPPGVVAPEATEVALTVSSGPQRVPVPDVAGYDAADARALIEAAGLKVGSTESSQAPTPRNVAVNTRPPAGATLPPGTDVVLVVSVGAATIRVPQLNGLTTDEARLALETAGLALGTAFAQTTTAVAPGEIFYQDPSAGTLSAPGTVVNVRIARRP